MNTIAVADRMSCAADLLSRRLDRIAPAWVCRHRERVAEIAPNARPRDQTLGVMAAGRCWPMVLSTLLALASITPAGAAIFSVGSGAGCTHTTLQAAIDAAQTTPGGPDRIKLPAGELLLTAPVTVFDPDSDLSLEGGYTTCTAGSPALGSRTVLRQTAANTEVLYVANAAINPRRYVNLRRLTLTGGNLPASDGYGGGGARVWYRATLILDQQSHIQGNSAGNGGGVALNGSSTGSPELFVTNGSSITNNTATGSALLGNGGGVYVRSFGAVRLINGEISENHARRHGGGVALNGQGTALHLNPPAEPDVDSPIIMSANVAGQETFSPSEGFGGAIYSLFGRIDITAPTGFNQFTTFLSDNRANYGGAIYVSNGTGPVVYVDLRNTVVAGNTAHGKGGAFYSRNQVQWLIGHSANDACPLAGARFPCSLIVNNQALNQTTPGSPGGGVGYIENEAGYTGGIFRFQRTLFLDNDDVNGQIAVAMAFGESVLQFDRSIFIGNRAGASSGVLLANAPGVDTRFVFNTVLGNDVDEMFFINGGRLTTQGSILWDPGTPIWTAVNGASMLHNACLIAHSASGLPGGVTVLEPELDARYAPRGGSPAIDYCDELGLVPPADLYGQDSDYDASGVPAIYGNHDLGAVENRDILFFGGFGTRFDH